MNKNLSNNLVTAIFAFIPQSVINTLCVLLCVVCATLCMCMCMSRGVEGTYIGTC